MSVPDFFTEPTLPLRGEGGGKPDSEDSVPRHFSHGAETWPRVAPQQRHRLRFGSSFLHRRLCPLTDTADGTWRQPFHAATDGICRLYPASPLRADKSHATSLWRCGTSKAAPSSEDDGVGSLGLRKSQKFPPYCLCRIKENCLCLAPG